MRGGDKQNYLFGPPTSRRTKPPGEGEMETGRGKKGKKAGWHLTLGMKDAIFAGIGMVGLMMISFALGTLAGRGDIYRAAYSWGLLTPETRPAVQAMPQVAQAPAPPTVETLAAPAPAAQPPAPTRATPAPAAAPAAPASHTATAAAAPAPHPQPVAGSIAPLPAPAAASKSKKKAKAAAHAQEQKAREDQAHRERQAMARKLTFLNSFDSAPKSGQKKDKTKTTAAKPQPTQIKVATYRDGKTAKAKMAELQKQGVKVSLKQGKDAKGAYYTLYRQAPAAAPAHPQESEKLAQKKEKPASAAPSRKPRNE
jgi:hypothetical protein